MDNDGAHGAEVVYGTHDDNNMVMSEKVNIDCGCQGVELFVSILSQTLWTPYHDVGPQPDCLYNEKHIFGTFGHRFFRADIWY